MVKNHRSRAKAIKNKITHTLKGEKPGFDFLGFTVRQYPVNRGKRSHKTIIMPSRESVKQHTWVIKHKLKKLRGESQGAVIKHINPIIKGWCQYYTSVVSCKIFSLLDHIMFGKLWKWAVYKHHNKGNRWIKEKYFKKYGNDNWRFMTSNGVNLTRHGDYVIKRHTKVKGTKTPYDGDWVYWSNRLKRVPDKPTRVTNLLKLQQGKCDYCQLWFKNDDILEVHHKDQNKKNNITKNLSLLHGHCHDNLHRKCA
ncbi:hypothetical protein MWH06_03160 [Wolbachia pipientis]|nr:hypothetical protein MWH06_04875 [Wolbachia pipientis]UPA54672.1 hypothetical protein MWH06_05090 [Wolbachia pipientis]UPA54946.1 hypothetical protein MWH06_06860 [Wolbachia pipientis]UPA55049.1 hypothetical protein MWH06_07470 [Wolbachia pipientis]UPA55111.1 hypothetical protein MWH06_00005 [Wolbachia pipientis]